MPRLQHSNQNLQNAAFLSGPIISYWNENSEMEYPNLQGRSVLWASELGFRCPDNYAGDTGCSR